MRLSGGGRSSQTRRCRRQPSSTDGPSTSCCLPLRLSPVDSSLGGCCYGPHKECLHARQPTCSRTELASTRFTRAVPRLTQVPSSLPAPARPGHHKRAWRASPTALFSHSTSRTARLGPPPHGRPLPPPPSPSFPPPTPSHDRHTLGRPYRRRQRLARPSLSQAGRIGRYYLDVGQTGTCADQPGPAPAH